MLSIIPTQCSVSLLLFLITHVIQGNRKFKTYGKTKAVKLPPESVTDNHSHWCIFHQQLVYKYICKLLMLCQRLSFSRKIESLPACFENLLTAKLHKTEACFLDATHGSALLMLTAAWSSSVGGTVAYLPTPLGNDFCIMFISLAMQMPPT